MGHVLERNVRTGKPGEALHPPHLGKDQAAAPDANPAPWSIPIPALFGALILANALSWLWACSAFAGRPALLGTALLAWMFGLRHAVDADHIAAIDSVVRKLMHDGKRPLLVGTYFSLGHSTVVVLASAVIAAAAAGMQDRFTTLHLLGGTLGTAVSALFLLAIAGFNLAILRHRWRRYRMETQSGTTQPELAGQTGLLTRLFRPLFRTVSREWHMLPIGLLFGLGFDTATEIGLLGLSAAEVAHGVSPWQTLVFPALFTAGMALVDSADSVMMVGAYGWALREPRRKLHYDLMLTATSVLVAVLIGGIEVLGLLIERFGLHGRLWSMIGSATDNGTSLGLGIIAVFLLIWATSLGMYRLRRRPVTLRTDTRRR